LIYIDWDIIIPLYNKEKYIEQTLKSVSTQNFENFEIIVVNDGSTDNSISIVEGFDDNRIKLIHQKNQGVSEARNTGIKEAKGDYIALLDADDIWFENHLQNFIVSINEFPQEKIFCNNYKFQFSADSFKKTQFSYFPSSERIVLIDNFFKSNLLDSIATSSTICIERKLFEQRDFDKSLKTGEDTDYWIYLALRNNFVLNKEISAIYRKEIKGSLSKRNTVDSHLLLMEKYSKEENQFLKRFLDLNRFSVVINAKLLGNTKEALLIERQIEKNNLNYKQLILLNVPSYILIPLFKLKRFLNTRGVFISTYE